MIGNIIVSGQDEPNTIDINVIGSARGEEGAKGPQGDPGVSVSNIQKQNGHLIITLTNGRIVDAGELPTEDMYFQYVDEIDGVNQTYTIEPEVNPEDVKYVCINGVIYPTGYTLSSNSITFNFPAGLIPTGRIDLAVFGGNA